MAGSAAWCFISADKDNAWKEGPGLGSTSIALQLESGAFHSIHRNSNQIYQKSIHR